MTPRALVGGKLWLGVAGLVALSLVGVSLKLACARHACHGRHHAAVERSPGQVMADDVLRMHQEDVRHCAMEARKAGPLDGRVELQLSLRPDGTAGQVAVLPRAPVSSTEEASSHRLSGCLEAAAYTWTFPSTGKPEQVSVPLTAE